MSDQEETVLDPAADPFGEFLNATPVPGDPLERAQMFESFVRRLGLEWHCAVEARVTVRKVGEQRDAEFIAKATPTFVGYPMGEPC